MTQNYEYTSGSENPDAAAWAELGKENGPVYLDVSTLDFSNIHKDLLLQKKTEQSESKQLTQQILAMQLLRARKVNAML